MGPTYTGSQMAKQRQVRIEQKSALAAMQKLETRSDEELESETKFKAAALVAPISLPFGGVSLAGGILLGLLLVVAVLGVLAVVGRRRQNKALEQRAAAAGGR